MFRKNQKQKGFTLVEMLIAMTIFMSFTGVLISSYTGIIKAQNDANKYREMYVQARQVFDTLIQELRDGMVDYDMVKNGIDSPVVVYLVSKDAQTKTKVDYVKDGKGLGTVSLLKTSLAPGDNPADVGAYILQNTVNLNDPAVVNISQFKVYYSPAIDPYDPDPANVNNNANQFHPKVTIYAEFTKDLGNGRKYTMDLQTSISSRIYSQVYPTKYIYTNILK